MSPTNDSARARHGVQQQTDQSTASYIHHRLICWIFLRVLCEPAVFDFNFTLILAIDKTLRPSIRLSIQAMISARGSLACIAILLLHHALAFKFISRRALPDGVVSRINSVAVGAKKMADGGKYSEPDMENTVLQKKDAVSQSDVGIEI